MRSARSVDSRTVRQRSRHRLVRGGRLPLRQTDEESMPIRTNQALLDEQLAAAASPK